MSLKTEADRTFKHVTDLYKRLQQSYLLYHNIEHTRYVVNKVQEIAAHYALSETDTFILIIAAWFHDVGQLFSYGNKHEEVSVSKMKEFLIKKIDSSVINEIAECILATKLPHHPKTLLQQILCDADTYNLGTEEFFVTDKLLKRECELRGQIDKKHWNENALKFLEKHTYFTSYCQSALNPGKQKNINILRSMISDE